jgi:two-component system nitrogen regulation sensor histidine kinase NtrY
MPKPKMETIDLRNSLKEAAFLVEVSRSEISFEQRLSETPLYGHFDSRLLGQAFGNIIKNASEAIEAVTGEDDYRGHILLKAYQDKDQLVVEVIDNGKGLPGDNRQRLLEPYMTTREKGTGLGLAIVRKIVEDHGGHMELHDAPADFYNGRGAMIRMVFPATSPDAVVEKDSNTTEELQA